MSTQFIRGKYAGTEKIPTAIHNDAVGLSIIKFLPKNAGIAYDLATGDLKYNANGQIRTITSSVATLLNVVVPQVTSVDLDGTNWHNGVGGKHDLITWDVPEDVVITRVIVATKESSQHPVLLLLLLLTDQTPVGTLIADLDLGAGLVCASNFDNGRHSGKGGKKGESDHDEKRELFAPKGSRLEFRASEDPIGLVGKALIFYVPV